MLSSFFKVSKRKEDLPSTMESTEIQNRNDIRDKFLSALFYAISSLAVIFINKTIMTTYNFPYFDFLAASQFVVTTLILSILIFFKKIENIPTISMKVVRDVLPISAMFLGNVICGLGSTRSLSLPMLTALRRFSILMTMLMEWFYLGNKPTISIAISVGLMVGGACVAAFYDFSFELIGYALVFLNNIFTALSGVWMKKAMSSKFNKITVLYYNSLFSAIVMCLFFLIEDFYYNSQGGLAMFNSINDNGLQRVQRVVVTIASPSSSPILVGKLDHRFLAEGLLLASTVLPSAVTSTVSSTSSAVPIVLQSTLFKVTELSLWFQWDFLLLFFVASLFGSVLNYSIFLCTSHNSALTTSVIGCLKNVLTTYVGMFVFSDYTFNLLNFIGLNISILGSLYYTYITLFKGVQGFGGA